MPKLTFILKDGSRKEVDAPIGLSVLEIAHLNHIEIEGACEGSLACSTCHVVVEKDWFEKLAPASEDPVDDGLSSLHLRVPGDEFADPTAGNLLEQGEITQNRQDPRGCEKQVDTALHPLETGQVIRVVRGPPHQPRLRALADGPVVELAALRRDAQHVRGEERRTLRLISIRNVTGSVQPRH